MIIIAVDPGEMCGWAMASIGEESFRAEAISAGQSKADDWEDWAYANVAEGHVMVVEKFVVTARTAQLSPQPRPIEVIGTMKFICRLRGATYDGSQSPSAAKRFATDVQLKKVGLWKPGQDHARDALRHLLLAIVKHGTGQAREEMLQSLA